MKASITFEIDTQALSGYTDRCVSQLWHIVQANPAPIESRQAAELAELVGREIIRRFLLATEPELYAHQGHHPYWAELHLKKPAEA